MQFCLQIQRQQLRTLGLHDGNVLPADHILEASQLFIGRFGGVVECHNQPGNTHEFVHWRHTTEDGEPLVLMSLLKIGSEGPQNPEGMLHFSRLPGAVGVRLPHADVARHDSVQCGLDLVIANFRVARITEKACMNKREVPHVQKILDYTRAVGSEKIGTCAHFSKRSVIPFGEEGYLSLWCAKAHPNQTISFRDAVRGSTRTRWWRL